MLLVVLMSAALQAPVRYELEPTESRIAAHTASLGILPGLLPEHSFEAQKLAGIMRVDLEDASALQARIVVDARSLYDEQELSAEQRREVMQRLHGEDVLDSDEFPTLELRAGGFVPDPTLVTGELANGEVVGTLLIRGYALPVRATVVAHLDGDFVRTEGVMVLSRRAADIETYQKLAGAAVVADRVVVEFSLAWRAVEEASD
jgi:hypothetical protein